MKKRRTWKTGPRQCLFLNLCPCLCRAYAHAYTYAYAYAYAYASADAKPQKSQFYRVKSMTSPKSFTESNGSPTASNLTL